MPDTMIQLDAVFASAEAAAAASKSIDPSSGSAEAADRTGILGNSLSVDSVLTDKAYLTASFETNEYPLDLEAIVQTIESKGAVAVRLEAFDEGMENVETINRKGGKKARESSVQRLIEKASPGYLAHDLLDGQFDKLEKLLDGGLYPNASAYRQPLVVAAAMSAQRYPQYVELVLRYGADANAVGGEYCWEPGDDIPPMISALSMVIRNRPRDAVQYANAARSVRALLDAGADANAAGPGAELSPLGSAVYSSNVGVVDLLIAAGADVDVGHFDPPVSPLSIAMHQYREKLDHAEPPTRDDFYGFTPEAMIGRLLRAGADPAITDTRGNPLGDAYKLHREVRDYYFMS